MGDDDTSDDSHSDHHQTLKSTSEHSTDDPSALTSTDPSSGESTEEEDDDDDTSTRIITAPHSDSSSWTPGFYAFGTYICIFVLAMLVLIILDFVVFDVRSNDSSTTDDNDDDDDDDDDILPISMIVIIFFPIAQLGMAWLGMSFFELWLRMCLFNDDEQGFSVEGYGKCQRRQVRNYNMDGGPKYVTTNEVTTSYTIAGEEESRKTYSKSEKIDTNELPTWAQVEGGEKQRLIFRVLKSDVSFAIVVYEKSLKERLINFFTRWCFPTIVMMFGIVGCIINFAINLRPPILLCIWLLLQLVWGTLLAVAAFKPTLQYDESTSAPNEFEIA